MKIKEKNKKDIQKKLNEIAEKTIAKNTYMNIIINHGEDFYKILINSGHIK